MTLTKTVQDTRLRGPVVSTKSADQKNKETEAIPVEEDQKDEKKNSKGRKSLKSRSPAMREKVKKSPGEKEKVEVVDVKTDEPKQKLSVEKKSRQKSRSPGHQRSVSPKKAAKKTENTGEEVAEGKKPKKMEGGIKAGGGKVGFGGKAAPKVNSGRSSQNKVRSPSPQLPVKTDQEKFEELFLVRRRSNTFFPMSMS